MACSSEFFPEGEASWRRSFVTFHQNSPSRRCRLVVSEQIVSGVLSRIIGWRCATAGFAKDSNILYISVVLVTGGATSVQCKRLSGTSAVLVLLGDVEVQVSTV